MNLRTRRLLILQLALADGAEDGGHIADFHLHPESRMSAHNEFYSVIRPELFLGELDLSFFFLRGN